MAGVLFGSGASHASRALTDGATWRCGTRRAAAPVGVDGGGRRKRPREGVGEVIGGRVDPVVGSGEQGKQQGNDRSLMPPRAISTLWPRSVCAHKVIDAMPVASRVTHRSCKLTEW